MNPQLNSEGTVLEVKNSLRSSSVDTKRTSAEYLDNKEKKGTSKPPLGLGLAIQSKITYLLPHEGLNNLPCWNKHPRGVDHQHLAHAARVILEKGLDLHDQAQGCGNLHLPGPKPLSLCHHVTLSHLSTITRYLNFRDLRTTCKCIVHKVYWA